MQTFGYVFDDMNGPNHGESIEDPVVPLEQLALAPICWIIEHKVSFCLFYVDDIKMAGKKQNVASMWKMMKNVDINKPTSFLDHVYLGCTQRECKPNETNIEHCKKMLESLISAGATENLPGW